jgi:hypothetical protein
VNRKRWTARTEISPSLISFREKRKWQIALRRYVLDMNPSPFYAPYFGLDIEHLRKWFETQFEPGIGWAEFGQKWQFGHIVPLTYFDLSAQDELKLCWNFVNLRAEKIPISKERPNRSDILAAKGYFEELHQITQYPPCFRLLEKLNTIIQSNLVNTKQQENFILENKSYLDSIAGYGPIEFEILNRGGNVNQIKSEIDLLKRFER